MLALLLQTLFLTNAVLAAPAAEAEGQLWAVLIAGSNSYDNYRHQADICHAYQIFHRHGIPDSNIIVFMYDDIAENIQNPDKGVIINWPNGTNVYDGVPKDYIGDNVTPETFVHVLTGNKRAVAHKGSGKVLNSGPRDHVFVYYADHGAPGLIGFPNDIMYADDLNFALKKMHKKKMYKKLVFYLEACESGSMFDNILPENINVYAVTAADPKESSYAIYWDQHLQTFLGDVFSVGWMEDVDLKERSQNFTSESLITQFANVANRLSKNTYEGQLYVSHPRIYGDVNIDVDTVANYVGSSDASKSSLEYEANPASEVVSSRQVALKILEKKLEIAERENDAERLVNLQKERDNFVKGRRLVDDLFDRILDSLKAGKDIRKHTHNPISMDMMPCYKTVVNHFTRSCVNVNKNTYALTHLFKLANLCAVKTPADVIVKAISAECTEEHKSLQGVH